MREHVFISYAKEDAKEAAILNRFLAASGVKTWIDFEQLMPGVPWQTKIKEAIKDARALIILGSTHSINKRGYVQNEIKAAIDKLMEYPEGDISVIVARLDQTIPREEVLQNRQWVDLFGNAEAGYHQILTALKHNERQEWRYAELNEKTKDRAKLQEQMKDAAKTVGAEQKPPPPYTPAPHTTGQLFKPGDFDIYVNKVSGEVYIFHGPKLNYHVAYLEYDYAEHWVAVVLKDGTRLDLGARIQWLIRPHWERCETLYIVQTKDGEAIDGVEVPLKKVGTPPQKIGARPVGIWESLARYRLFKRLIDKLR